MRATACLDGADKGSLYETPRSAVGQQGFARDPLIEHGSNVTSQREARILRTFKHAYTVFGGD